MDTEKTVSGAGESSPAPDGSAWLPVTPDAPPTDTSALVCGSKRLAIAVAYRNKHGEWLVETCSDVENIYPPKWWMPLPPLPEPPWPNATGQTPAARTGDKPCQ